MGRTQDIGAIFSLHQEGYYGGNDTNGDPIGATWCITGPTAPIIGDWTVELRMVGPVREVYDLYGHLPFPFWGDQGIWSQLGAHLVRDMICEVEAWGPGGYHSEHSYTLDDAYDLKPYILNLTGESPGALTLKCAVANTGHHRLSASFLGEPFPWAPYSEFIGDQHSPPSGQFARIETTSTGAEVEVVSGGDERFNAAVTGVFEWPIHTRVRLTCKDVLGRDVVGKKLFVMFGPFAGNPTSPLMSRYLFERQTPLDEVFHFPVEQVFQEAIFQHVFLESYSGNPSPPFPRFRRWGSQELTSGRGIVALAFDRAEFGIPSLLPRNEFRWMLSDGRNWPRCRFHPEAGVTRKRVATMRLPSSKPMPLTWEVVSGGAVDGDDLIATGPAEFRALLSPAFECRPYRYLSTGISIPFEIELRQGFHIKTFVGGSRVDMSRPIGAESVQRSRRGDSINRGLLLGDYEGIAGLTEIRLRFADATVTPNFELVADEAEIRWLGQVGTGDSADDQLHIAYGRVDDMEAFRVPYRGEIRQTLAEMTARMGLEIDDEDYEIAPDWAHRYDYWAIGPDPELPGRLPMPSHRYIANFEPTANALEDFDVRMTLTGQGCLVYPGIGQDQMFGGSEPFLMDFECLWGPGTAASVFAGTATGHAISPQGEVSWPVSPWGVGTLDPRSPQAPVDGSMGFVGRPTRLPVSLAGMGQVTAFAGAAGSELSTVAAYAIPHPHAEWAEVLVDGAGVLTRLNVPETTVRAVEFADVTDAQLVRVRDATLALVYARADQIWRATTLAETLRWSEPELITNGSEVAIAACPILGLEVAAIWHEGAWTAWRLNHDEWTMVGAIVSAEAARAGLVFAGEPANALIFVAPIAGQIRRFESLDYGQTWEEI